MVAEYSEEQIKEICERVRGRGLFYGKEAELLCYMIFGREATVEERELFYRVIKKYLYKREDSDGNRLPPEEFDKNRILQEIEDLKEHNKRPFTVIFGLAVADDGEYLPDRFAIDGEEFLKIEWGDVCGELDRYDQRLAFMNDFVRTMNMSELFHVSDEVVVKITGEDLYKRLEGCLSEHVYYLVSVEAFSMGDACNKVEKAFGKVLAAVAMVYATSAQEILWQRSGLLKRRAPVIINGVFLVTDERREEFYLVENEQKIIKCEQPLVSVNSSDEGRRVIQRNFEHFLDILGYDDVIAMRLAAVGSLLYNALASREVPTRHLGLWQCIESGVGWEWRKEKDMVKTLKNYYDMSDESNLMWGAIGDYIHAKRCLYVHEGVPLSLDIIGSYDSPLNLYMDYIRVMILMLSYLWKYRDEIGIVDEPSFRKFIKYYTCDNDEIAEKAEMTEMAEEDRRMIDWLRRNRRYGS